MIRTYNGSYDPNEIDRPIMGAVSADVVLACFEKSIGYRPHIMDVELTGIGLGVDIAKTNDFYCAILTSHYRTLIGDNDLSIAFFMDRERGVDYTLMPERMALVWQTARDMLDNEVSKLESLRVFAQPELKTCIDGTGVGSVVIDFIRKHAPDTSPINVQSTAGQNINQSANGYTVPSIDIVSPLRGLLNTGRLFITDLGEIGGQSVQDIVTTELRAYSATLTPTGHMKLGNDPSIAKHDDTVIALSLGVFPYHVDRSTMASSAQVKFRRPLVDWLKSYYGQ